MNPTHAFRSHERPPRPQAASLALFRAPDLEHDGHPSNKPAGAETPFSPPEPVQAQYRAATDTLTAAAKSCTLRARELKKARGPRSKATRQICEGLLDESNILLEAAHHLQCLSHGLLALPRLS